MTTISRRSILKTSVAAAVASTVVEATSKVSFAQTENYVPADLKNGKLTPFGAVQAGNADGSIPAWTGGYSTVPPNYQQGDPRPVPFADEKPLYSVTAANLSQYKDKLSQGVQGLFLKYPNFRIDVYPTHRTAIAPQYVYDYTYANATNAKLSPDGTSVTGAYGGLPFPIPKDGNEVMWNHLLAWQGTTSYFMTDAHLVTSAGEIVLESRAKGWIQYPYYFENGASQFNGFYNMALISPTAPPYEAGGSILILQTLNPQLNPPESWIYLEGQRRTRRAPELEYDTPSSLSGGTTNWDEVQIFSGKLDKYDFTYLGVKEIIVPYNGNKMNEASYTEQLKPNFVNPDLLRWELHRCRVVEMTLKSGARNVDARRIIYCDEDTGSAILGEVYDANGSLWKVMHNMPCIYPDIPCVQTFQFFAVYDLHAGDYSVSNHYDSEVHPHWKIIPELPASFFTPGQLAAESGGF